MCYRSDFDVSEPRRKCHHEAYIAPLAKQIPPFIRLDGLSPSWLFGASRCYLLLPWPVASH